MSIPRQGTALCTITDSNIDQFRDTVWPDVFHAKWNVKGPYLDAKVLANLPNLQTLDFPGCELTSLVGLECCPKLEILNCYRNNLQSLVCDSLCSHLTSIRCSHNPLISLDGLENYPGLTKLNCSKNYLRSLDGLEHCSLLETLNCSRGSITNLGSARTDRQGPTGIYGCPRLLNLNCAYNSSKSFNPVTCNWDGIESFELLNTLQQLRSLNVSGTKLPSIKNIQGCVSLTSLVCVHNDLCNLDGIESLTKLEKLNCSRNNLTSLRGMEGLVRLQKLECGRNRLSSIVSLASCVGLIYIRCSCNELITLVGIENCSRLEVLACDFNYITHLDNIVHIRTIRCCCYHNNPLAIQSPAVERFCDRLNRSNKSIYDDGQNVHDAHVQKSVCCSLVNLLSDGKPEFSIDCIINSGLDQRTIQLLLEYCEDSTVHSVHLLTYFELLGYVWTRITKSEHKPELFKILAEQIHDSECKCFTGRFNRTLSVLMGFYKDIVIAISDKSRIGAIILAIKDRIRPYDHVTHKTMAQHELLEAGYTEDEIKAWIEAIDTS